jgi:hypothetical protein
VLVLEVFPTALFAIASRIEALARTLHRPGLLACLKDLQIYWQGGEASGACVRVLSLLIDRVTRLDIRLLGYDPAAGHLIAAFGDPVTATNVAVYVPGAGTTIATSGDELARARLLRAEAGPGTCVIMWLGYRAPTLAEAVSESAARAAAEPLRRFQAALVAAHDGPIQQLTLIGHSYGSVVIGVAERDGTLLADDLVALGSPGMGVRSASALRDPTQVWHSTATNDPIRLAPAPILGVDPESPWFGGNPIASAPYGHSGYLRPGNPALATLAALVSARCPR